MRPAPWLLPVVVSAVVALLAGCGSGLPAVPTEPTWSHTTEPPTTDVETPAPILAAPPSTVVDVDLGAVAPRPRPRPLLTPPPAPPRTTVVDTTTDEPTTTEQTTTDPPTTSTPTTTPVDRPFRSCTEARRAGAAPLHVGEPGYNRALDRDGDGIACEISR